MKGPRSAARAAGLGFALLALVAPAEGAAAPDPWLSLLRPGVVVTVRSQHPDAVDSYELRLRAKGGSALDCVLPGLEADAFRATFTPEAMARGDAVLVVTQTNPDGRAGDEVSGGPGRPRRYTYRKTTPPFLVSEELAALAAAHRPITLHFYDALDGGKPVEVAFASVQHGKLKVDRDLRSVEIARFVGKDAVLELVVGSRLVWSISRGDGEFEMRLVKIATKPAGRASAPSPLGTSPRGLTP